MRHVPKKLTDCPENLRESIDWLIQVRYGNGEGDKGLGELAKALKKLIEEAIGNATTSFEKREKELQCPDNPSAESSYCRSKEKEIKKLKESKSSDNSNLSKLESDLQKHKDADHYMIKEDRDKELKDIDTRRIQLGELAGQLGSFIGGGGKVSEAIKKAQECLNEQYKQCEKCKTNKNSGDCQDPSNCQSIKEKIEKLEKFNTQLKTSNDNPKKLLENLCDGLQTFLGYDKNSKGYDGRGIVYSDLDRLCDAVMGFLSGVLSNIKGHLGQHKDTLNDAVNSLKQNKHLGKKGFDAAIVKVVKGVRGYNGFLKISNERVSKPVVELLSYFTEESPGKFRLGFNAIQVASVSDDPKQTDPEVTKAVDLVTKCLEKANEFNGKLDFSVPKNKRTQNAINDLNHELRVRVHSVRETVKYETDRLTALSRKEKENYEAIVKMVKKLAGVQSCFKSEITQRVDGLVKKLKEDVQQIKEKLEAIYQGLERSVSALDTWAWEADGFVSDALKKLDVILDEVDNTNKNGNKKSINYSAALIAGQAITLFEAGEAAKKAAQENARLALTRVKEMDAALKMDLFEVKGKIKEAIWSHVREHIKTPYDALEGKVKEDLTTLKGKITGPLGEIVRDASNFNTHFRATQAAIDAAISAVQRDMEMLQMLTNIDQIKNSNDRSISAPLLKAIGGDNNPFQSLVTYFDHLNTKVMHPLRTVMVRVGDGLGRGRANQGSGVLNATLQVVKEQLSDVQKIVNGEVPSPDITTIKLDSATINMENVTKLSENLTSHSNIIEVVVNKLNGKSEIIDKTEATRLLSALGQIAQAVSQHSHKVVEEVMTKIKSKMSEELKLVAGEIVKKMKKIKMGSHNNTDTAKYGDAIDQKAAGLQWLAAKFGYNINTKLTDLQTDLGETIFKKANGASVGDDNYDLGVNLMSAFKEAYDALNTGKLEQIQVENNVDRILNTEVGGDIMTGDVGVAANKISNIDKTKFPNYTEQVNQDTLEIPESSDDVGHLPKAIKQIKTKVDDALGSIENLKTQIVSHADDVKSKLAAMCEIVKKAAEGNSESAKGKLSELRSKIGRNTVKKLGDGVLMKIRHDLNDLKSKNLNDAIMAATDFSIHAERLKMSTISGLESIVDTQLNDCMAELTKQANTHYVTTMRYLLKQFADKVRGQLAKLPEAIEEDLTIGFKGFMGAFQGKNGQVVKYDNIEQLKEIADRLSRNPTDYKENFEKLANKLQSFWQPLKTYLDTDLKREYAEEMKKKTPPVTLRDGDKHPYAEQLENVKDKLNILLTQLQNSGNFTHSVAHNLGNLHNAHDNLVPTNFTSPCNTLLDALKSGINALAKELSKTYLNAYDGASDGTILVDARNDKVTDDGKKCAKAFLSLLSILYSEFKTLLKYCVARCKSDQINMNTDLGKYFATQGYKVTEDGKKHWELQDSKGMTGLFICKRLFGNDEQRIYNIGKSQQNALDKLHDCLQIYYRVTHVSTFSAKRRPCNIFEMLCWMSGLPCNNVYADLLDVALSDLFVDPKKETTLEDITVSDVTSEPLAAYPQPIAYDDTRRAVKRLCSRSHDVLTTIAGPGDAYSMYAVDYSTNWLNFHYPSKGEDCLQMLLDILRRLQPSLKFLHTQCGLSAAYHGWSGCQYGREVKHSNWQCREHTADESTDCQPRSPLMSYLRDCLPGCLPHQLVSAGCKSECKTCPKSLPGAPCITPLGFRGFSGSTKTGKDICTVLTKFFDNSNINTLSGLLPKPPSTLPEHFQFALTLSHMLDNANAAGDDVSLAFETKTKALSIELYKETSKLTGALQNAYRNQTGHNSAGHSKSTEADLWSLSRESCDLPHDRDIHCAPYLCSTSCDAYKYLAKKHASLYLSWAIYLPWTFYGYLKSLLDAFQQIDCGGSGCTKCSCKPGKHGVEYSCKCNALISCRGVITTFYQYGFTFGDSKTLYGTNRKFCLSFSTQLSNLLKSQHFAKLFEECDNFIWTIRQPFIWLNVALWSLSLFYLLCVMVGRLDVLHIRSHLRTPSSHRITAQSLLAAAQVGRLAKISYLQP